MTDRLTQLQDCLDQLLTQMFATIRYIDTRHPYSSIPGQSDQNPYASSTSQSTSTQTQAQTQAQTQSQPSTTQQQNSSSSDPFLENNSIINNAGGAAAAAPTRPDSPRLFHARLQELAQDLVLKEQQIEVLIDALPGLGNSQEAQEARIKALQGELEGVNLERRVWAAEREALVERVEGRILSARRV